MRYFVTGATGFLGRQVARQLFSAGHEVVALVRSRERAGWLAEAGATLVVGDVTDRAVVRQAMTSVDGVYHVAGVYKFGPRHRDAVWRGNVEGTRCVLETMRDLGIPKGVYTSSIAIFSDTRGRLVDESYRFRGKHISVYDETKAIAHYEVAEKLQREGLPLVIVQPGLIYGPGGENQLDFVLVEYLKRRLPYLPLGTAYCLSHVEDSARGHLLAMERGRVGESYIISGPAYTIIEVFEMVELITGIPAPKLHLYPGMAKMFAEIVDLVDDFLPLPPIYQGEFLRVTAGATLTATDVKAREELGFETRPLLDGLRETVLEKMRTLGVKQSSTAS